MAHLAKLITDEKGEVKVYTVSNGAIAFHAQCCDDPTTETPHTLYFPYPLTDDEVQQRVDVHLRFVEVLHAARERARDLVKKYKRGAQ
jgi:hypothetical protein